MDAYICERAGVWELHPTVRLMTSQAEKEHLLRAFSRTQKA